LRDVATWAGVELSSQASTHPLWTNFLIGKDGRSFYGLVYATQLKDTVSGSVQWLKLPAGRYRVTELISGQDLGIHDAAALRTTGLSAQPAPRALAIWKMERQ